MRNKRSLFLVIMTLLVVMSLSGCDLFKMEEVEETTDPATLQRVEWYTSNIKPKESKGERKYKTKFYYEQLSEIEKKNYKSLRNGMLAQDEKIYVENLDLDQIFEIFEFVTNDYPEIFWCDSVVNLYTADLDEDYNGPGDYLDYSVVEIDYNYSREERAAKEAELIPVIDEILTGTEGILSDHDKIKFAFDQIVYNTNFNLSATDNQNILSVFLNHSSVCAGYSKAIQLLLEEMKVYSTYVTGYARGEGHAWNLVSVDGVYKYVDATYTIPATYAGYENFEYFLCDYNKLSKSHTFDQPQWTKK